MNSKTLRRAAGMAAILASGILSGGAYTVLAQVVLPTGATITPNAAPGSVFEPLKVDLPDYTNYSPDSAETTAISPDGDASHSHQRLQPESGCKRELPTAGLERIRVCV